ncbi:MAG: hypothetical protein AAGD12_18080, partial [Pseudomonadota bacterium]
AVLGHLRGIADHGAGDVLEIAGAGQKTPLMLPFTRAFVPTVDLAARRIVVDLPDEDETAPEPDEPAETGAAVAPVQPTGLGERSDALPAPSPGAADGGGVSKAAPDRDLPNGSAARADASDRGIAEDATANPGTRQEEVASNPGGADDATADQAIEDPGSADDAMADAGGAEEAMADKDPMRADPMHADPKNTGRVHTGRVHTGRTERAKDDQRVPDRGDMNGEVTESGGAAADDPGPRRRAEGGAG